MTTFPTNNPGLVAGLLALLAGPLVASAAISLAVPMAVAQESGDEEQDTPEPRSERPPGQQDEFILRQGDRRPLPRNATRRPRSIIPGPYIPPGSLGPLDFGDAGESADNGYFADETAPAAGSAGQERGPDPEFKDPEFDGVEATEATEATDTIEFGEAVETDVLAAPDPASSGILTPENGGFPAGFWRGTDRRLIENLMLRLPVATRSPAANAITRKLLLSAVALPPIAKTDEADNEADNFDAGSAPLLETRLQRLADTGDIDALTEMLELVPAEYESAAIRDIRAETYLLAGDLLAACDVARLGRSEEGAIKWLRISALCQALEGDQGGLGLSLGLLEETGDASPQFMMLIEAALSRTLAAGAASEGQGGARPVQVPGSLESGQDFDAFYAALYQAAGIPIPVDVIDTASPALLGALSRRPELDLEFRVEAGEIAAGHGVTSSRRLASAFEAMEFTTGEKASALLLADTDLGARVNALLFQMALAAETPVERLEFVNTAWRRAQRDDLMPALAGVLVRTLRRLARDETLVGYADQVGRIALYAGEARLASEWYEMARRSASFGDIEATRAMVGLWPLMIVSASDNEVAFSQEILDLWRQGQASLPDAERFGRASLFYATLEALGYRVPEELWQEALAGPLSENRPGPSLSVWRQLIVAGRQGRQGETVLLALIALGEGGPAGADPSALSTVIRALRDVGLEAEARSIALEALISNGM